MKQGLLILFLLGSMTPLGRAGNCQGRFLNPITDICWKCLFPLRIGGVTVAAGGPDSKESLKPLCSCSKPPLNIPLPGIPISFWEPVRLVDVTRTPYCLINMGGLEVSSTGIKDRGHVTDEGGGEKRSYYNVHWYLYPVLSLLEVLLDFACLDTGGFDMAYVTELDPLWNDDAKAAILNPEAILFGNPLAQAACAADCAAASTHLPRDELFWCAGCQGSLYPFGGTVGDHTGGVQASLLVTSRFMAKLHREGVLWGTSGAKGLCRRYPLPIIKKSQYRTQMTYPLPQTSTCQPLGATEVLWQGGREYPRQGEDFGYLIWRKRSCCLGAL